MEQKIDLLRVCYLQPDCAEEEYKELKEWIDWVCNCNWPTRDEMKRWEMKVQLLAANKKLPSQTKMETLLNSFFALKAFEAALKAGQTLVWAYPDFQLTKPKQEIEG